MINEAVAEPAASPVSGGATLDPVQLRSQLERLHPECFGWALTCCRGDRDSAAEVLQTVYVDVLDGRARSNGDAPFRAWLFGVIRIAAAAHRRATWLRVLRLERGAHRLDRDPPMAADAEVERASREARLRTLLGRLSARQQEVLQLVFYHDFTVEGAAGVMRVSVGTARTHYARGKARLGELLGGRSDL